MRPALDGGWTRSKDRRDRFSKPKRDSKGECAALYGASTDGWFRGYSSWRPPTGRQEKCAAAAGRGRSGTGTIQIRIEIAFCGMRIDAGFQIFQLGKELSQGWHHGTPASLKVPQKPSGSATPPNPKRTTCTPRATMLRLAAAGQTSCSRNSFCFVTPTKKNTEVLLMLGLSKSSPPHSRQIRIERAKAR